MGGQPHQGAGPGTARWPPPPGPGHGEGVADRLQLRGRVLRAMARGQHLLRAVPAHYRVGVLRHVAGQQVEARRVVPGHGLGHVLHGLGDGGHQVRGGHVQAVVGGAEAPGHHAGVLQLVALHPVHAVEADAERGDLPPVAVGQQRHQQARVHPAREQHGDLPGPRESATDGGQQRVVHVVAPAVLGRLVRHGLVGRGGPPVHPVPGVVGRQHPHAWPGAASARPAGWCVAPARPSCGPGSAGRLLVDGGVHSPPAASSAGSVGGHQHAVAGLGHVQRLHAQRVAGEQDGARRVVRHCERELAVQVLDEALTPAPVRGQDQVGVVVVGTAGPPGGGRRGWRARAVDDDGQPRVRVDHRLEGVALRDGGVAEAEDRRWPSPPDPTAAPTVGPAQGRPACARRRPHPAAARGDTAPGEAAHRWPHLIVRGRQSRRVCVFIIGSHLSPGGEAHEGSPDDDAGSGRVHEALTLPRGSEPAS